MRFHLKLFLLVDVMYWHTFNHPFCKRRQADVSLPLFSRNKREWIAAHV